MIPQTAKDQINKAVTDYDDGRISRAALETVVSETIDELQTSAYEAGVAAGEDKLEEEYVLFEAEMDLDDPNFLDPDDDGDDRPDPTD